jgi:hypothetical protein
MTTLFKDVETKTWKTRCCGVLLEARTRDELRLLADRFRYSIYLADKRVTEVLAEQQADAAVPEHAVLVAQLEELTSQVEAVGRRYDETRLAVYRRLMAEAEPLMLARLKATLTGSRLSREELLEAVRLELNPPPAETGQLQLPLRLVKS